MKKELLSASLFLMLFFVSCTSQPTDEQMAQRILYQYTCAENAKVVSLKVVDSKETTAIDKGFANLDIKVEPSDKAKTIKKIETKDCFEALEIKGDWMKVRTNEKLDCNESKKPIKIGWIKWKDNNRLTINFFLTC